MEGELRRAAFGDLLAPAPALLAAPESARSKLLAAIVLGARGRYAQAATLLVALSRRADPVIAALALTTLASHRRQLGGHEAARRLDARSLRLSSGVPGEQEDPDGLDARGAFVDGLLGLAADNLGSSRLSASRRLLEVAAPLTSGWRARVRAGWVTAEIELAAGEARAARTAAETALELAGAAGARRHVIKSQLVLAAALLAVGESARAEDLVCEALAETEKFELRSLAWPAAILAGQLWPARAAQYRFRVDALLHAVLLRSDAEGRILARESPWIPV